jgi:hypothetical protein
MQDREFPVLIPLANELDPCTAGLCFFFSRRFPGGLSGQRERRILVENSLDTGLVRSAEGVEKSGANTIDGNSPGALPDDYEALVEAVEAKREQARAAVEKLRRDLEQGRPVDREDLEGLSTYDEALREARARIASVLEGEAEPETVSSLRLAAMELKAMEGREQEATDALVEVLQRLAEMPIEDSGPDLLKGCRQRAAELLEPDALQDGESLRLAEGLAALVRLNGATDEGEKSALTAQAMELLPADCQAAVGLAAYGNLKLGVGRVDGAGVEMPTPTPTEAVTPVEEPPAEEPATQATAHPTDAVEVDNESSDAGDPSDEEIEAALEELFRQQRFGLAHWIVVAWPTGEPGLENALKALAYSGAMRSPVGEAVSRFRELVQAFPVEALRGDKVANLIALVAGLRGTLVAPYSGASDLLGAVAASYSSNPGLASLIEAVTTAGQRGLSAPDMTEQVQDIAVAEDNLRAVQERAEQILRLSTIKYARASNVWRKWIEPDGMLGWLLNAVADDRAGELKKAEQTVFELRSAKTLERRLDETDRLLRAANRQRPIVADARQKLIERAEESLGVVAEWVEVSQGLERVRQKQDAESWQTGLLEDLRTVARDAREEVTAAWEERCQGNDLRAAAAIGTLPIIEEIFSLVVDGESFAGDEEPVDEILGLDLLRVRGLGLDTRLEPSDELRLRPLLAAVSSGSWEAAFEGRVEEANFDAAERIVEIMRRQDPEFAAELEKRRLSRLGEKRDELRGRLDEAGRKLGAARREGRVSDSDGLALTSELSARGMGDDQQDFRGVDVALNDFLAKLKQAEQEGERKAREAYGFRLAEEPLLQPYRERLQRLLDQGEISTLEELVLAIERDEDPPEEASLIFKQLTEFFPAVANDQQVGKAGPEADALAATIADRGKFGALDFASLKDEEIEPVQAAVDAWWRLDCSDFKNADDDLVRILDLIGLTVEQGVDPKIWQKGSAEKRKRAEFSARPLGKALVPAFGSAAQDGRYRLLMLWEGMSDEAIAALISQEDGEQPIVVLSFRTALQEHLRRGVADQLRHQRNRRAVALIDGPTFLYFASKGGRNLATTMRITLPFSVINPYTPFAPGSVPLEMFYGRDRELSGVVDRNGTSFIYGGRRLGKSALLRAAERKFNTEGLGNRALYVDLKTKGIGEREPASKIVSEIAKALKDADVMTIGAARQPRFEDVCTQVKSWLEVDGGRRILLLLDECDSFLNEDAKEGFPNVSELKALMEETDRRFKPVFAGLHQVRRFQRIPNQPLAHLGYPTPVGPLKPQPAYDLIAKPLEALGMKFETPDLPTRILTATNYQPSLIQLFCSELVDHMLDKARGPGTPPYPVSSRDVEAVYHTPRVVEEMRTRFELTTNLDPRYRVIANSVAFEALGGDLMVGLSAAEIRAMCDEYWPVGFAKTGSDEFRALLEEMDSLGVLFEDGEGRFLMRSPNVLRMLGTAEQIEEHLKASNELELPLGFEAASFRDSLGGDPYRRQPFTHEQVAGLLAGGEGEGSQLRVVVGSPATGIGDAMACLEELFEDGSGRYSFKDASLQDAKRLRARFNRPAKKKHRVVVYRLKPGPASEALTLIRSVGETISRPESNSTVVFSLEAEALQVWQALVAPEEHGEELPDSNTAADRLELVELKRWTKAGLRAWAQAQDVDLFFNEDRSLKELIRVTGGWPMLVNRVVDAYIVKHDWRRAIKGLEQWLNSAEGAQALCDAIGLAADSGLAEAWSLFMVYGEPIARRDFQSLADDEGIEEAGRAAEILRSMQVLTLDANGRYVVEETAARAWRKVRPAVPDAAP